VRQLLSQEKTGYLPVVEEIVVSDYTELILKKSQE
jgi:hypothetical protein